MPLAEQSFVLPGFALPHDKSLFDLVMGIAAQAPFRTQYTPGGKPMSARQTSCGACGWVSDRKGYRYADCDPLTDKPWPVMPVRFAELAHEAAACAGFNHFQPDTCLLNVYEPGSRMGLHQDRDEASFAFPIVSVSLGLPAVFQFGGAQRSDTAQRVPLQHGDVVVWGGADRLRFHGVQTVKAGRHDLWGAQRVNLTFRRARL